MGAVHGGLRHAAQTLAAGTAPSHWRNRPAMISPEGGRGLGRRSAAGRILLSLAISVLLSHTRQNGIPLDQMVALARAMLTGLGRAPR
jgi:hypothetical protein